jgi:hypothetical protein
MKPASPRRIAVIETTAALVILFIVIVVLAMIFIYRPA